MRDHLGSVSLAGPYPDRGVIGECTGVDTDRGGDPLDDRHWRPGRVR